jgi:hypothetical protein
MRLFWVMRSFRIRRSLFTRSIMVVRSCKVTRSLRDMRPFKAKKSSRSHGGSEIRGHSGHHKVIQGVKQLYSTPSRKIHVPLGQDHDVLQGVKKLYMVTKNSCPVLIHGHEVVWGKNHKVIHGHEITLGSEGHRSSRGHSWPGGSFLVTR